MSHDHLKAQAATVSSAKRTLKIEMRPRYQNRLRAPPLQMIFVSRGAKLYMSSEDSRNSPTILGKNK